MPRLTHDEPGKVYACPGCDAAAVIYRDPTHPNAKGEKALRCRECGRDIETPDVRESRSQPYGDGPKSKLESILEQNPELREEHAPGFETASSLRTDGGQTVDGLFRIRGEVAAGAPVVMTDWMDADTYGGAEEARDHYADYFGWSNLRIQWYSEADTERGRLFDDRDLETFQEAVETWGWEPQVDMANEEAGEVITEMAGFIQTVAGLITGNARYMRGRYDEDELIDELADVRIMYEQMAEFIGRDRVEARTQVKMDRLRERLEEANRDD